MVDLQLDAQYELLNRVNGAYGDSKFRSFALEAFDKLGYTVDRVFEPYQDGGRAIGLSSKDGSKPPVLVLPGGDPGNPRSVGNDEFTESKQAIQDWINGITNDPQANPQGLKPDVTGRSRGGSLTQLVASEFPTLIGAAVTFVAAGIDRQTADKFLENSGDPGQVRHYVVDGDSRSLLGESFIPGKVTVANYQTPIVSEPGQIGYDDTKHGTASLADPSALFPDRPEAVQRLARFDRPKDLTLSEISVDELNRPDFTWKGQDWQALQAKLQENNPNLAQLTDRQGFEELRDNVGAGIPAVFLGGLVSLPPVPLAQVNQPTDGDDVIFGTACDDTINGGIGDDYIRGGADGSDQFFGNDVLLGGSGRDALIGGAGNDTFNGGADNDILTGGGGNDVFVFGDSTPFKKAALGTDRINDFMSGQDKIGLSKATFNILGEDLGNNFANVSDDASAATSTAAIVYNTSDGKLFYNTNGATSGLGEGGQFATLFEQPTLTTQDFVLV
jgi:serralysin